MGPRLSSLLRPSPTSPGICLALGISRSLLRLAAPSSFSVGVTRLSLPAPVCRRLSKALVDSFSGMYRGQWRPSVHWMGLVRRLVGTASLSGGISANSGRSRTFDLNDSPQRLPRDLEDLRTFRGPFEFSQWRMSAWEGPTAHSTSAFTVGFSIQTLCGSVFGSNFPGLALSPPFSTGLSFRMKLKNPRVAKTSRWHRNSSRCGSLKCAPLPIRDGRRLRPGPIATSLNPPPSWRNSNP